MTGLLCYRLRWHRGMAHWVSGCLLLLLVSFVATLLLQPVAGLGLRQRLGLLMVIILLVQQITIWQWVSPAYLQWLHEASCVSGCSDWLWLVDLVAFWVMWAVAILGVLPMLTLFYEFTWWHGLWVYGVWCVVSPLLFVQLFLLRLLGLWMRSDLALVWVMLVPWVVPTLMMVLRLFERMLDGVGQWSDWSLLLGLQMILMFIFCHLLSGAVAKCYHHLRLQ